MAQLSVVPRGEMTEFKTEVHSDIRTASPGFDQDPSTKPLRTA